MFAELLSIHYDSYHPDYSITLVNSLKSYINLKLDHERKTPQFITELRGRLYLIHEYNCHVAKVTHKYPQSKRLESLLIKYIELECDALYSNKPSRQLELATELRVLRLLHVMLYPAILNNESLVSKHTDRSLKTAVLQLLGQVSSRYLVKNKLVCNITNALLQKIDGREVCKNLATSDYGSEDSDSDFESNSLAAGNRSEDCVEVPLTTNGVNPVPTIEFTDDDDNYFVYLQKGISTKRKINSRNSSKNKSPRTIEQSDVIVCSDSEDETPSSKNKEAKGVVTFEILDDEDEDQTNYMVYLQREVETNRRVAKQKTLDTAEVIVCSDSEDDERAEMNCKILPESEEFSEPSNESTKNVVAIIEQTLRPDSEDLSHMSQNFRCFDNEPSNIQQTNEANFLVDHGIIFDTESQVATNSNASSQSCDVTTLPHSTVVEMENVPGGPVMCEKINCFDDFANVSECRPNDSLLEELLLDDNYLLEGRKEFEELEYFLFSDNGKKSSLSNFPFDDHEMVLQPETFDADIKSLESFLADSELISATECTFNTCASTGDIINKFENSEPNSRVDTDYRTFCKHSIKINRR